MNDNFGKAFKKFDECMTEFGKGVESLVNDVFTEKGEGKTTIKIKKGSTVMIGKNTYAKLTADVEAELVSSEEDKENEKTE